MAYGLATRIVSYGESLGLWSPGDTLLDPMAGMLVNLTAFRCRGYHVVGIELEPMHYASMLLHTVWQQRNAAWAQLPGIPKWGEYQFYHGDAREVLQGLPENSCRACVFSPPYEAALAGRSSDGPYVPYAAFLKETDGDMVEVRSMARSWYREGRGYYGESEGQIGRMSGRGHWEAMSEIYRGLHRVIEPGGALVVVTKDRRAKWELIPIGEYTHALIVAAGFDPLPVHGGERPNRIRVMGATRSQVARLCNNKYVEAGREDLFVDHEDLQWYVKPSDR